MPAQIWQNDLSFQGKPFSITVIQVYAPTTNAEEAEVERFYEDLQDLLELTPKKDVFFIIGDWNAKLGSREIPTVTGSWEYKVNEAGQRLTILPRERTSHSKHPLSNNTKDNSTHGHQRTVNTEIILIMFFAAEDGEALTQSAKTRPGADGGSDHELLIAKFRLKLKKVGNHYTVQV